MDVQVIVAVLVTCLGAGMGYQTGAPQSRCTTMIPGHGVESTNANPYTLTTSVDQYSPGTPLTVTISGSGFQGLLLQARVKGQDVPVGTFSNYPANTKGLTCGNSDSSVTHSSTTSKSSGTTFTWTAPASLTGEIEFVATVASARTTWWLNTKSASLTLASGGGGSTNSPGSTNNAQSTNLAGSSTSPPAGGSSTTSQTSAACRGPGQQLAIFSAFALTLVAIFVCHM